MARGLQRFVILACAVLPTPATVYAAGATRAASADAMSAVRECRAERDDGRRLACFDAAVAEPAAVPEAGAPADGTASIGSVSPAAAATTSAAASAAAGATGAPLAQMSPEQRFGFRGDVARAAVEQQKAAQPQLEKLTAEVTGVARQATGDFVVTLENGQVWAQLPVGTPQRLKTGDVVTITPAALGSFLLKGPTGRGVRVKRVR